MDLFSWISAVTLIYVHNLMEYGNMAIIYIGMVIIYKPENLKIYYNWQWFWLFYRYFVY